MVRTWGYPTMFKRRRWSIVRGDLVEVIRGPHRGSQGRVVKVLRDQKRPMVFVDGVNVVRGGGTTRCHCCCQAMHPLTHDKPHTTYPRTHAQRKRTIKQPNQPPQKVDVPVRHIVPMHCVATALCKLMPSRNIVYVSTTGQVPLQLGKPRRPSHPASRALRLPVSRRRHQGTRARAAHPTTHALQVRVGKGGWASGSVIPKPIESTARRMPRQAKAGPKDTPVAEVLRVTYSAGEAWLPSVKGGSQEGSQEGSGGVLGTLGSLFGKRGYGTWTGAGGRAVAQGWARTLVLGRRCFAASAL